VICESVPGTCSALSRRASETSRTPYFEALFIWGEFSEGRLPDQLKDSGFWRFRPGTTHDRKCGAVAMPPPVNSTHC
jgi:hypothetical protein